MYRISLTNGTDIAIVDEPYFIRLNRSGNGTYCPAKNREEALGVAVNGKPYALFGKDGIDAPVVTVTQIDGGIFALQSAQNAANIDYISAMTGIDLPTEEIETPAEAMETEGE